MLTLDLYGTPKNISLNQFNDTMIGNIQMSEFYIDVAAEVCINFYRCNNLFLNGGKFKIFVNYSGSDEISRNCSAVKCKQIHVREYG